MDYYRPLLTLSLAGSHATVNAVLELLNTKAGSLPFTPAISGVLTQEHGCQWQKGRVFSPEELLRDAPVHKRINGGTIGFLKKIPSDVFLDIDSAESDHGNETAAFLLEALHSGRHVITNNRAALAFHLPELQQAAERTHRLLRFESCLLDGLPVFNLRRYCLQGERIHRIRGILNSTSNYVLQRMAQGIVQINAVAEARAAGLCEQNPDFDLNGWDAALKVRILATALMDGSIDIAAIRRDDWNLHAAEIVARANKQGGRPAQIASIEYDGERITASVRLQTLAQDDAFFSLADYQYGLALKTDSVGELVLLGRTPGLRSRAFGFLADLMDIYTLHIKQQRPSLFDSEDSV